MSIWGELVGGELDMPDLNETRHAYVFVGGQLT
jgi:hypothetical protein